MIKKKKEFSLDLFIRNLTQPSNESYSNELFQRVNEINNIIMNQDVPEDYNLFDHFTRNEIEWYADALIYWPYDSDSEEESAGHVIVQNYIISDVIKQMASTKPERKKGFRFI